MLLLWKRQFTLHTRCLLKTHVAWDEIERRLEKEEEEEKEPTITIFVNAQETL